MIHALYVHGHWCPTDMVVVIDAVCQTPPISLSNRRETVYSIFCLNVHIESIKSNSVLYILTLQSRALLTLSQVLTIIVSCFLSPFIQDNVSSIFRSSSFVQSDDDEWLKSRSQSANPLESNTPLFPMHRSHARNLMRELWAGGMVPCGIHARPRCELI